MAETYWPDDILIKAHRFKVTRRMLNELEFFYDNGKPNNVALVKNENLKL